MRPQEQPWLQYPLSSWSSFAYGKVSKLVCRRGMGFLLSGKVTNISQQKAHIYVQGHEHDDTRVGGYRHGNVSGVFQGNSHAHGCGETVVEQQQKTEMQARQHLKMFMQARRHGYTETIATQEAHVHKHVQGQQYEKMPAQQTWQAHREALAQLQPPTPLQQQQQREDPVAHRPLPKRLLPMAVTRRSFSTHPRSIPFQQSIPIADTIQLTELEFKIFNTIKAFLLHYDLRTKPRVAGGWVRDKLLGRPCGDIDITLDDMLGRTFCRKLSNYCRMVGMETAGFGVIKSNPTQAKHLEVAKMYILGVTIDFVNLRSHDYTESSFLPFAMQDFGTIVEDAFRRDLTINSLFYNIITERIEDPTGKGLVDLRSGIIATPLHPKVTFTDDPLRVLRALRFVSELDYNLHPDAKDAIDADIKLAFSTKISRHRMGGEVEKLLTCINPLKAFELLVETGFFHIVFGPPADLDIILPEGIERVCMDALQAVFDVVEHFGSSKLQVEDRKSLYLAAFLSPLRTFVYEHNSKLISISTAIIKESLKLRSIDAAMVTTLHKTAGNFTSIRKLVLKMDTIDQGNGELFITDMESQVAYSHAKHQIVMLLEEMRGLWRSSLLLGAIFEDEEALFSLPRDKRKTELTRRSHLCIFVEEALVRLGLEKMNGPSPFVDRRRMSVVGQG